VADTLQNIGKAELGYKRITALLLPQIPVITIFDVNLIAICL
jgi:hypothetical protein